MRRFPCAVLSRADDVARPVISPIPEILPVPQFRPPSSPAHPEGGSIGFITLTGELVRLPPLTPREMTVLECLSYGPTNKEIASELELTEATARAYVGDLIKKTRLNRHQLGIVGYFSFQTGCDPRNQRPCVQPIKEL